MKSEKVIVVGAGVAGLSLAIMLAEQGIESVVLDARERFDGPTSGVRISAEGVELLRLMKMDPIGENTERVDMRFGRVSASFPARQSNCPAIIVTRLALHEQLMKCARALGIRVVTDFKVVAISESVDRVEAASPSRETVSGTVLVGADGVGSTVRRFLNSEQGSKKIYAGYLGVGLLAADEEKTEMTLHRYPGHEVGVASCGRVNAAATRNSIFMWTHIHLSERDARLATKASVEGELAKRAEGWRPELARKYDIYREDVDATLAFGPIYNGTPPGRWYSNRMMLIGDAAHPYGPGGQGISMALKDAKGLCGVIVRGFSESDKAEFRQRRGREARALGEAAERRNAKVPSSTTLGLMLEGVFMKTLGLLAPGAMRL
ncbi:MAG: NAD(P)/FAD-dependent oxidoreductase [Vicinamibacterales bacterium]